MNATPAVFPAPVARVSGGRAGTATVTLDALRSILGAPHYASQNGKVTAGWVFYTPRGIAEVRDYWWNGPNEQSIGADNRRAAMWLCRYLRQLGIPATTRRVAP